MVDARRRRMDIVLVWRFDRFARSSHHLVVALEEFRSLGIDFVSFQEAIGTSSPLGGAIFTIISAVAQLERDILAERVRAGLRMARSWRIGLAQNHQEKCQRQDCNRATIFRLVLFAVGLDFLSGWVHLFHDCWRYSGLALQLK
jgi:hypothetical protein